MAAARLQELTLRIAALHAERRRLARASMTDQAALVFDLLPALLHCQHQALPAGDISAPHGIKGVEDERLRARIHDKLGIETQAPAQHDILAVYSMGSTGTLGQTLSSDLDIWVCHRPCLGGEHLQALRQKCNAISEWATGLGMELTFFLVNPDDFRSGNKESLSCESCGTFQHWLLLDEFYRSAICLAGQLPIWLLTPVEDYRPYEDAREALFRQGLIRQGDWLDLGSPEPIPADEFLGAMLWQLYKGIERPYKSLLKLSLLAAYARQYPEVQLLSVEFKRRLHQGEEDPLALDPYLQMESYLARQGLLPQDRELLRRCLFLKCGGDNLADAPQWRKQTLTTLAQRWGWSEETLEHLSNHRQWPMAELQRWHQQLQQTMQNSLHQARELFRRTATVSRLCPIELTVLSRKLDAGLSDKPGKVQRLCLPPGVEMAQSSLALSQQEKTWLLSGAEGESLFQGQSLTQVLAWAELNGLLHRHTELQLDSQASPLDLDGLDDLCRSLARVLDLDTLGEPSQAELSQPAQLKRAAIYVNLDQALDVEFNGDGDALSYGPDQLNLVRSLELVTVNSWGEILCERFAGPDAVVELVLRLMPVLPTDGNLPDWLSLHCVAGSQRRPILDRLKALLDQARQRLGQAPMGLNLGKERQVLWFKDGQFCHQSLDDPIAFYAQLSASKLERVSKEKDVNGVPRPVLDHSVRGLVQFFFLSHEGDGECYTVFVSDESNRVEQYREFSCDKATLVGLVSGFYAQRDSQNLSSSFNLPQYYELRQQGDEVTLTPFGLEQEGES
ncbi:class I adenylate cyclase [Gallaecimonas sp. GXIMD4217]|uniref:class I adenylate cyclase n=1 Tax=Gallaecimonas sp. GXIMD4217 TaxID=3131927 RepID=UPI00311AD4B5